MKKINIYLKKWEIECIHQDRPPWKRKLMVWRTLKWNAIRITSTIIHSIKAKTKSSTATVIWMKSVQMSNLSIWMIERWPMLSDCSNYIRKRMTLTIIQRGRNQQHMKKLKASKEILTIWNINLYPRKRISWRKKSKNWNRRSINMRLRGRINLLAMIERRA